PGFPLDGGRVLRAYLWYRTGDIVRATKLASRVGVVFAMTLMGIGLVAVLSMHLIPGAWLILIGLFLKSSAENEYRSFEIRVGLQDMRVRDVMVPPVPVHKSMTISEFLNNYVFHYHDRVFPVVESDRFAGMIDVRAIKRVPANDW